MRLFRQLAILTTLGCGLFTGYVALVPLQAVMRVQPTTAAWDASACPAGTYTVQALAVDGAGQSFLSDPVTVTLPASSVPVSWSNLAPGSYTAKATASNGTGLVWESASQPVTGLGIAQTPTPTPTPTPVPGQSPDCVKNTTITVTAGTWSIEAATNHTLLNGVWRGGGLGKLFKPVGTDVYVQGTDNNWYRSVQSGDSATLAWAAVPGEPACGTTPTPTPTPTVTPTPTPTVTPTPQPTPTPVDLSPVLAKLDQLLALVKPAPVVTPTPLPTASCAFSAVNSTSVYIKCARTDFPTAAAAGAVKVIK